VALFFIADYRNGPAQRGACHGALSRGLTLALPRKLANRDGDIACPPYLISRKTCFHWYPVPEEDIACTGAAGRGCLADEGLER